MSALLEVQPAVVPQGGTVSVRLTLENPLWIEEGVVYKDRRLKLYEMPGSSVTVRRALLGLSSQTNLGAHQVLVHIWREDMAYSRNLTSTFTVVDAFFPKRKLNLRRSKRKLITSGKLSGESVDLSKIWKGESSEEKMWQGPFVMPTSGRISSPFGVQRSYGKTEAKWGHSGMDIANKEGTPILAPAGGNVLYSSNLDAHGGTVILDHGHMVFSLYHHLSKRRVIPGERVYAGDVLGDMGQTGLTTGPHLHWSMIVNGVRVNPIHWVENNFE